jgi:glycosyltransferase 2 family protein
LPRPRRKALLALQIAFTLAVAWFAGRTVQRQWADVEQARLTVDPRWGWIVLSALVVLATYLLLIEVWIVHLRDWGQRIAFLPAARIWFVSNLGRYIPGKVVGLGTMALMAERRGVSGIAAIGSSILVMLIGMVAGLAVVMTTGARVVEAVLEARGFSVPRGVVVAVVVAAIGGLLLAPVVLPRLAGLVARITGREAILPSFPASSVWLVAAGSGLSWVLYGIAFQLFTVGMLGHSAGGPGGYIAVYTAAYLVGLLSLIPGGLVVREAALVLGLSALSLATAPEAALLALTSLVWRTILEILPGALFLLMRAEDSSLGQGTPAKL